MKTANPYAARHWLLDADGRPRGAMLLLLASVIALHLGYVLLLVAAPETLRYLALEDGWMENLQAAAYGVAAVLAVRAALRVVGRARLWLLLFALVAAVMCGEEISWGQRILRFEVPQLQSINAQNEANLHNIEGVNTGRMLSAGSLLLGLVLPAALALSAPLRGLYLGTLRMPAAHPAACLMLVLGYLWYITFYAGSTPKFSVEESRETSIALGILLYAWHLGWEARDSAATG